MRRVTARFFVQMFLGASIPTVFLVCKKAETMAQQIAVTKTIRTSPMIMVIPMILTAEILVGGGVAGNVLGSSVVEEEHNSNVAQYILLHIKYSMYKLMHAHIHVGLVQVRIVMFLL